MAGDDRLQYVADVTTWRHDGEHRRQQWRRSIAPAASLARAGATYAHSHGAVTSARATAVRAITPQARAKRRRRLTSMEE